MSPDIALISVAGAVGLLLYGMSIVGEGLQRVAGQKLRHLLATLGKNRLAAVAAGATVTVVLQSSSATTLMLVGFARAGLMQLRETIGLILGADIGTTVTVQLLAFRVYDYALLIVAVGAALMLSSHNPPVKDVGRAVLGFGLVFLALKIIVEALSPLRGNDLVREVFVALSGAPLVALLLAAIFAAVTTSSAATVALALILAGDGLIPMQAAIPMVLGANLGTTVPGFISGLGGGTEARRVSIAHVLFKVLGAAICLPLVAPFASLVGFTSNDLGRQVANAHTIFNVVITLVFLPLSEQVARLLTWLVPEQQDNGAFRPKYLDEYVLESPPLALGEATRETIRLGDMVQEMVVDTLRVFRDNDEPLLERLERVEDQVDYLSEAIKAYLTKLSQQGLTEEQSKREVGLLYLISELEHIGDVVDKSMLQMARQKIHGHHTFSEEGWAEILSLHGEVVENLRSVLTAIATRDQELAQRVLSDKAAINKMERELRQAHIRRLHVGLRESLDTSSIHIDLLNDLKRVNSNVTNMAYVVLGEL